MDVPENVRDNLEFHFVKRMDELVPLVLKAESRRRKAGPTLNGRASRSSNASKTGKEKKPFRKVQTAASEGKDMSRISKIFGREILDSRGNPTVEVDVVLESGARGRAAVPSGASTGKQEALELRDGSEERYGGKGVLGAVHNVNSEIGPALLGRDALDQARVDETLLEMDGTDNLSRLGANAVLGTSMACAKAAALHLGIPLYRYLGGSLVHLLPTPLMNVLNGGRHADNNLTIQEFMIVPGGPSSYVEALRVGVEVYHTLKSVLAEKGPPDHGGGRGGIRPGPEIQR